MNKSRAILLILQSLLLLVTLVLGQNDIHDASSSSSATPVEDSGDSSSVVNDDNASQNGLATRIPPGKYFIAYDSPYRNGKVKGSKSLANPLKTTRSMNFLSMKHVMKNGGSLSVIRDRPLAFTLEYTTEDSLAFRLGLSVKTEENIIPEPKFLISDGGGRMVLSSNKGNNLLLLAFPRGVMNQEFSNNDHLTEILEYSFALKQHDTKNNWLKKSHFRKRGNALVSSLGRRSYWKFISINDLTVAPTTFYRPPGLHDGYKTKEKTHVDVLHEDDLVHAISK